MHRPTFELLLRTTQMSCLVTQNGYSSFQPDTHHSLTIQVFHTYFSTTYESCVVLELCPPHPLSAYFIEEQMLFIAKLSDIHNFLYLYRSHFCFNVVGTDNSCFEMTLLSWACRDSLCVLFLLLLPYWKAQHGPN